VKFLNLIAVHGIAHRGVSSDGTWQRRGYSSMNGCVTTISMDTGRCIDVEVLSKVCHACQRHEKHQDINEERVCGTLNTLVMVIAKGMLR
jgi:hypothetical protein